MRSRSTFQVLVCLSVVTLAGLALTACGGGGSSGSSADKDLVLMRFLLVDENLNNLGGTGTLDAFRDVRILLVFNTDVDIDSVTTRTIRVGIPVPGGLWLEAPGRFETVPGKKDQIVFNPTVSKNSVPNPFGLEANSLYEVFIPSVGDQETWLTNLVGHPIAESYLASFTTGSSYQQNFIQPEVIATEPDDGDVGVGSAADIIVQFSEPMLPDSFRLGTTVFVRNLTTDRDVLGTLRFSADAKQVTFRPVFGYEKGPSDIFFRITTAASNLPGNPIPKEVRIQFQSEYDPTRPDFSDNTETFDDNSKEDTVFANQHPLANWNAGITAGYLAGAFTSGLVTITTSRAVIILPPWAVAAPATEVWQCLFYSAEVGGSERVITGFDWLKYCLTANSVSGVTIRMGHTQSGSLTTTFSGNFSDTPVTCVNNAAYSFGTGSQVWQASPAFTGSFAYNGKDNLILEISHAGAARGTTGSGNGEWYGNNTGATQRIAYTFPTGVSPRTNVYQYETRFNYLIEKSEAQSLWYDSGIRSPAFLEAIIIPSPADQPAGTVTQITFQGAPEDLTNPGNPDVNGATNWLTSLENLTGNRFVRFHVNFTGNRATNVNASIDAMTFPFIYY